LLWIELKIIIILSIEKEELSKCFHLGSISQILNQVNDCVYFHCSTACLVGITGVFAPLLEETVFRGFFMTSLTKWYWLSLCLFLLHLVPCNFLIKFFALNFSVLFPYILVKETQYASQVRLFSLIFELDIKWVDNWKWFLYKCSLSLLSSMKESLFRFHNEVCIVISNICSLFRVVFLFLTIGELYIIIKVHLYIGGADGWMGWWGVGLDILYGLNFWFIKPSLFLFYISLSLKYILFVQMNTSLLVLMLIKGHKFVSVDVIAIISLSPYYWHSFLR